MRVTRPFIVLSLVATTLVAWFVVRMGFGAEPLVWRTSCLLGAWAPVFSAIMLAYVRSVSDREHSVSVAWLVRAIGMHCVLLWMCGIGDWLGGPPGGDRRWIADAGAPLVLLGFVPVFAVTFTAVEWLRSVSRRIPHAFVRPAMPGERSSAVAFRGVELVRETVRIAPNPSAAYVIGATSIGASWLLPEHSIAICGLTAAALALACVKNSRALLPSVLSLIGASLVAGSARVVHGAESLFHALAAAPWTALAAIVALLFPLEFVLRARQARATLAH
ncbi:MAG: hypothetical protein JNK05_20365 [Myxococcales bacterium]|nr:hypothetical protein [Myxococcales bacterium]